MSEAVHANDVTNWCIVYISQDRRAPSLYLDVLETLPLDHRLGLHTLCRLSWDDDWSLFASETPVLILLDLDDLSVPLATALRRVQERFEESAILVATADAALGAQAIARGADELITDVTAHETGLRLQTAIESHSRSLGHRREHSELRAELISLSARTQRDALTGLYTRSAFLSQVDRALSRARRLNTMVAVVYFDLDGFKTVNDSHGHHAGDAVLSWFAQALLEQFRCEDCLGRMGGDEFVLLLEDLEHPIHAFASAKKIRKLLQGELVIEDVLMELDASVGISMYPKSPDTQALISHADMAMYAAKKRPEDGKVRFFDARLEAQLIARESCRLRLEGKLARRRCSLALQPLYDYESGQLNSVEALFRWPFSETTQEVIEFAERQGFIQRLDMQMLEEAIKAFQKLRKKAPHYQKLHVNASVLSLDIHYREQVVRLLDTHLMDPAQLCIEVTETALSQDYEQLAKDLRGLRKLGLELALDDFGTGYASLRYLRDLSFHSLKLDRELVSKIGDDHRCRALCHASIDMAKSLQIKVTGEGVESSDQFSLLREMGCDFAQGYYLARPSSPEALANSDPLEFVF